MRVLLAVALALCALPGSAVAATVETLPFGPLALNDNGDVAGHRLGTAQIWRDGTLTPLPGGLEGFSERSRAVDINDAGQITGYVITGNDKDQRRNFDAVVWDSASAAPRLLGRLDPTFGTKATAISDLGTAVGWGQRTESGSLVHNPVRWPAGSTTPENLLSNGLASHQAVAVNNTGAVLLTGAQLWRNGQITQLNGCLQTEGPHVLSDANVVVGRRVDDARPAYWQDGECRSLALPEGFTTGTAYAINSRGQIVGRVQGAGQVLEGVLWEPDGTVVRIDTLLPEDADVDITGAYDINDRGQILGDGRVAGEPVPLLFSPDDQVLGASLAANPIADTDMFSVGLSITNGGQEPLTGVTLPSGTGIVKDGALGLTPLFAPLPTYPAAVAGESVSQHVLGFEVTSPGAATLFTRVKATNAAGGEEVVDAAVRIEAGYRDATEYDYDAMVSGGLAVLLDQVARERQAALGRLADSVRDQIRRAKGAKGLLKANGREQALAHQLGLPPKALSWIQRDKQFKPTAKAPGYQELAFIFLDEAGDNFAKKVGKHLDATGDKIFVEPAKFWRDMLFDSKDGEWARVGHELAAMSREGLIKGSGYLGTAGEFWRDPGRSASELWTEVPKIAREAQVKLDTSIDETELKILKWDALMEKDPRKGVRQFATIFSNVEAGIVNNAIDSFFDPVERLKGLNDFRKAQKAAGKIDDAVDIAPVTRRAATATTRGPSPGATVPGVKGAKVLAVNDDVARSPLPGLGNMTPHQLDYLSSELRRINQKFDVDLELQIRPVNAYSAQIKNGIGKVEAIPTKNLKPEDVLMGAPAEWLGQPAYYKPTLPKNFDKLPAHERKTIKLRFDEKLEEYKQFAGLIDDPSGKTAKVEKLLKAGGAEVRLGTAYEGRIELKATKRGDATLLEYKKLEVNGRPVFDPKQGPRPIVSDFDMNALVDKRTGRHLPAGIRGQIELELMGSMSKAQHEGLIPFGFHGWTHSGFDINSSDFRYVAKHMLMYASEAQALAYARRWAPKFFPELGTIADPRKFEREYRKAIDKILSGYERGKHLVKISAQEAVLGPGIDPNVGIPLP